MLIKGTILAAVVVALGLTIVPGCGRQRGDEADERSWAEQEQLRWHQEYHRRRPEPPREYTVFPKPPRDNHFREFDDDLHRGLDSQAELPLLPGDQAQKTKIPESAQQTLPPFPPLPRPATPTPPAPVAPGLIRSGDRFYPIEQLVYGGDEQGVERSDEYRLMPRDIVTIAVREHPEFSATVEIQADGTIVIPNTPDMVRLRGLTSTEAENEIKKAINPYVKGDPEVKLQTNRARGGYYYVIGEVRQPGRFPLGLEPVRLSDAIMAANWEANPGRTGMEGDDLTPSFPAAAPRGRYASPPEADLSRVLLITPHRSRPIRSVHDARAALLGMTGDDPRIRPGQIVAVPSLHPSRNAQWGLETPAVAADQDPAEAGYETDPSLSSPPIAKPRPRRMIEESRPPPAAPGKNVY